MRLVQLKGVDGGRMVATLGDDASGRVIREIGRAHV